jgi:Mobilization protein NikA
MTAHDNERLQGGAPLGRRSRQLAKRCRRVEFSLTDEEFADLEAAAARAGLARGAYAADAALSVARGVTCPADNPFREALGEFIRAAGLVRRIGVNLNQAVAKLNATGQRSGDLLPFAAACLRRAERLDAAAEEIRRRLR